MPRVLSARDSGGEGMEAQVLQMFLWLVVGTVISLLLVTLWYRHSDRLVQRQVALARHKELVLPTPDFEEKSAEQVTGSPSRSTSEENPEITRPEAEPAEGKIAPHNRLADPSAS
jgi:hypothetical protein